MAEKSHDSSAPGSRRARPPATRRPGSQDWDWHAIESARRGETPAGGRGPEASRAHVSPASGDSPVGEVASAVLGGLLMSMGLARRSLGGAAMVLAGGGLLFRSLGGQGERSEQ